VHTGTRYVLPRRSLCGLEWPTERGPRGRGLAPGRCAL